MKQLVVWILQTGEPLHTDPGHPRPMRAMALANALLDAGHRVILWSSAFFHQEKRHRSPGVARIVVSNRLEIRLIPSSGYQKNVGGARLIDHALLGVNLWKMLRVEEQAPDVAFVGYPPIEAAWVMCRWLSMRNIPFLLDVKDLWPWVFLEAVPLPFRPLGRVALAPFFFLARGCVNRATGVSAMSDSFLARMLAFGTRERGEADGVFPLTTSSYSVSAAQLNDANKWLDARGIYDDGTLRICYVGNLSPNVDLGPVKTAAKSFIEQRVPVEFVISGDGVSLASFKATMASMPNVHFPGRIDRPQILALARRCCAALVPYVNSENFQLSLPNKVLDSLSLGLPILSPLTGEVANLISLYNVGLRYGTDSGRNLEDSIKILGSDALLRERLSKNALNLYQEKYSFDRVYGKLVKHLEKLRG